LVENLTRRTPSGLELARDLQALRTRGHSYADIGALVGVSESHAKDLINLVENGEGRLIAAVERGDIPVSVAMEIATLDDNAMQHSLQEAYDAGRLKGRSLTRVRRIMEDRQAKGKALRGRGGRSTKSPTPQDLVRTLRRETQRQELTVRKARHCEHQLRFVVSALKDLFRSERFITLLRAEKLDAVPKYLHDLIQR